MTDWEGLDSLVAKHVKAQATACLNSYRAHPTLVEEHVGIERRTSEGGYGRRQLYELVQNGADAMMTAPGGRIVIVRTASALYCANEGAPVDLAGVTSILQSHISKKRGTEIGRFGLGFKSVLGVTDSPEFFSRTGSFRFSPQYASLRIKAVVGATPKVPILRVAEPICPKSAADADPLLNDLMGWASTVIKLPCSPRDARWLGEDMRNFPGEFLLFSPHIGGVELHDEVENISRSIKVSRQYENVRLNIDGSLSTWHIFETTHRPSAEARKEAGELAEREELPLIWAVPLAGAARRQNLWAFFPTEFKTTITGILNAPWKTNEDRQNLLTGLFNEELLKSAARLIIDNVHTLARENDPGLYLDAMPARGREAHNWADEKLTEYVYERGSQSPSVPDQTGTFRNPTELQLHPRGLPEDALKIWAAYHDGPEAWAHHSCDTRERRSRVERLFNEASRFEAEVTAWIEALSCDGEPAGSVNALRVAAALAENRQWADKTRSARVVLCEGGDLVPAVTGQVFMPSELDVGVEGVRIVHRDVAADENARKALSQLGIGPLDPAGILNVYVEQRLSDNSAEFWDRFWEVSRQLSVDNALEILHRPAVRRSVRARSLAGNYTPISRLLLGGAVVPVRGGRDEAVAVDEKHHRSDLELLRALGVSAGPDAVVDVAAEPWFGRYRDQCIKHYITELAALPGVKRRQNPNVDYLTFASSRTLGPLEPLWILGDEGRAKFTHHLLDRADRLEKWGMEHKSVSTYPTVEMENPAVWAVRRRGLVRTSRGLRVPAEAVGPTFTAYRDILPVALLDKAGAGALGLPGAFEELLEEHWTDGMNACQDAVDVEVLGRFYAQAARHAVVAPRSIRCRAGENFVRLAPDEVHIARDARETRRCVEHSLPFVSVTDSDAAAVLAREWGLADVDSQVRTDIRANILSDPVPLPDHFPALRLLGGRALSELQLARCESIRLEHVSDEGSSSESPDFHREGRLIYASPQLDDRGLLEKLSIELQLNLDGDTIADIVDQKVAGEARDRLRKIAAHGSDPDRLVEALGARRLRRHLRKDLIDDAAELRPDMDTEERLARLALATHGVEVLKVYSDELREEGIEPPGSWAGRKAARDFVRSMGFGQEFAGFQSASREPLVYVDGPSSLPLLHDFQRTIADRVRELVRSPDTGRRGLLSLPTGAGKTRTAVQALVECLANGELKGPLLWIAQTDELCEQAVQAWRDAWRALGTDTRLAIGRLWSSNDVDEVPDVTQVVVATVAKLGVCLDADAYEWLRAANCVIVDEAHASITAEYTKILGLLELGRGRNRCPLIGLTATPFRGTSETQTERLAKRYGQYRLDTGVLGDDPYEDLQARGILAQVDHELLAGTDVKLTSQELADLTKLRRLPRSVERRIGGDEVRNKALFESITSHPEDWPILVFAASVEHAENMASLLSLVGVPARSVSGATDSRVRRHYVSQFREGKIRVLTNYAVFTEGFDAPSVRAVYVARPTFSPNLYQQMVGRGLRGPANGGKDRCLIVNVADNFLQYGEELAFRGFEYLWGGDGGASASDFRRERGDEAQA